MDVLILLTALTVPSLQGLGLKQLGIVALESIVLFYGIEIVMQERGRTWDPLRIGILASLTVLALKGLVWTCSDKRTLRAVTFETLARCMVGRSVAGTTSGAAIWRVSSEFR